MLYNDATTWGCTPADYIGVDDEYLAFCLNQAVAYAGKFIENAMEEAAGKAKTTKAAQAARDRVLKKYLSKPGERSQFMDPAVFMSS